MPIRVQRFRLRLMRYSYNIAHVPGKDLCTAPVADKSEQDETLQNQVEEFVAMVISTVPATPSKLEEVRGQQDQDEVCNQVKGFCRSGWPKGNGKGPLKACQKRIERHLLLRGHRLVIPMS